MTGRYQRETSTTAFADVCTVEHEFDAHGNHRLTINGKLGDWTIYGGIAIINWEGHTFAATTEYFDTVLPEVFQIFALRQHGDPEPEEEVEEKSEPERKPQGLAAALAAKRAAKGH